VRFDGVLRYRQAEAEAAAIASALNEGSEQLFGLTGGQTAALVLARLAMFVVWMAFPFAFPLTPLAGTARRLRAIAP